MPVERVDAQIQSIISQSQVETQKKIDKEDEADQGRKAVEKKIEQKREQLKTTDAHRETYQRQNANHEKIQQVLGGAHGKDAADALAGWKNNPKIQAKLTETQKERFYAEMAKNPPKTAQGVKAVVELANEPGFDQAITNTQQMGTLQEGLVEQPKAKPAVREVIKTKFMQSPKADPQVKNQFLRFGFQQAKKGQLDTIKKTGDMLGTLTTTPKTTQRAAMNMVVRTSGDAQAITNVDSFVQHPAVAKLPSFARGKATELVAKSDGKAEVKEGFETLVSHPKFRAQSAQNKGRVFVTIGSGRPSEYRALTDKTLVALQSPSFPKRDAQVTKLLVRMSVQVQKGGADSVDPEGLIKSAKTPTLPKAPVLGSMEGLDEEQALKVRSQNRAKVIQFYTQVQRSYEESEKKLNSAKYLEDVNALTNLREPENLDTAVLSSDEQAFVEDRRRALRYKLDSLRTLTRQKSRELRTKRIPPAKRRAMLEKQRIQGRQPKYFTPNAGRTGTGSEVFTQTAVVGAPLISGQPVLRNKGATRGGRVESTGGEVGDYRQTVSQVVSQLGPGPITNEKAAHVADVIAKHVAAQVAQEITQQLLGNSGPVAWATPQAQTTPAPAETNAQTGKVDGWGIPRTFERDLGATPRTVVKAPAGQDGTGAVSDEQGVPEAYSGKTLVTNATAVRAAEVIFASDWKSLSRAEAALLRNLGWNQQTWDTRNAPGAKWPVAMMTGFMSLRPVQRESVRKLGFSPGEWDKRVQALSGGRSA